MKAVPFVEYYESQMAYVGFRARNDNLEKCSLYHDVVKQKFDVSIMTTMFKGWTKSSSVENVYVYEFMRKVVFVIGFEASWHTVLEAYMRYDDKITYVNFKLDMLTVDMFISICAQHRIELYFNDNVILNEQH